MIIVFTSQFFEDWAEKYFTTSTGGEFLVNAYLDSSYDAPSHHSSQPLSHDDFLFTRWIERHSVHWVDTLHHLQVIRPVKSSFSLTHLVFNRGTMSLVSNEHPGWF